MHTYICVRVHESCAPFESNNDAGANASANLRVDMNENAGAILRYCARHSSRRNGVGGKRKKTKPRDGFSILEPVRLNRTSTTVVVKENHLPASWLRTNDINRLNSKL